MQVHILEIVNRIFKQTRMFLTCMTNLKSNNFIDNWRIMNDEKETHTMQRHTQKLRQTIIIVNTFSRVHCKLAKESVTQRIYKLFETPYMYENHVVNLFNDHAPSKREYSLTLIYLYSTAMYLSLCIIQ